MNETPFERMPAPLTLAISYIHNSKNPFIQPPFSEAYGSLRKGGAGGIEAQEGGKDAFCIEQFQFSSTLFKAIQAYSRPSPGGGSIPDHHFIQTPFAHDHALDAPSQIGIFQ